MYLKWMPQHCQTVLVYDTLLYYSTWCYLLNRNRDSAWSSIKKQPPKNTFYCCFHFIIRKGHVFPGTRWILWESSGVGNLTQPPISHELLLLSKMQQKLHCIAMLAWSCQQTLCRAATVKNKEQKSRSGTSLQTVHNSTAGTDSLFTGNNMQEYISPWRPVFNVTPLSLESSPLSV